jgi:hypothetical protein
MPKIHTHRNGLPLYYCRCDGDGSWLVKLNADRGSVFSRTPEKPAKITLDEATKHGIADGAYALVPVTVTDSNHVVQALVRSESPLSYDGLWSLFVKSSPFGYRFQRYELGFILNNLVRVGRVEIDANGLGFSQARSKESKQLREALADGWKALRGDSNDAEHDALAAIIEALTGEEA